MRITEIMWKQNSSKILKLSLQTFIRKNLHNIIDGDLEFIV
jgi:hypothetical protein